MHFSMVVCLDLSRRHAIKAGGLLAWCQSTVYVLYNFDGFYHLVQCLNFRGSHFGFIRIPWFEFASILSGRQRFMSMNEHSLWVSCLNTRGHYSYSVLLRDSVLNMFKCHNLKIII